jgi:hypothetical protein
MFVILSGVMSCAKARGIAESKDPYPTKAVAGSRGPSTPRKLHFVKLSLRSG